tara:strand:- start:57 stop:602 length:546 start_codon:yes stop_codon:yes gene_type:complete
VAVFEILHASPFDPTAQDVFDLADQRGVFMQSESQRFASIFRPSGAPDAVNVGVNRVRHIEVYDVGDLGNVDASRGHIGGDQHVVLALAESVDGLLAFVLGHIALQHRHAILVILQVTGQPAGAVLGACENDHSSSRHSVQDFQERLFLQAFRHRIEGMRDGLGRRDHAYLHCDRVIQHVP